MNNFKKAGRVLKKTPPVLLKKRILKSIQQINKSADKRTG